MGWLKQLGLSWTILVAAAACVSCQELRSTLRQGNYSCPGEEIIFTCTIRGPSTVLILGWSSAEYIGQGRSLQLSTVNVIGAVERSTGMDGNITATATVTNNTNVNGELILESTLRITATVASTVTCSNSGTNGATGSTEFSILAVPGVPQRISAAEISRPRDDICIILVTWNPPANSDVSDVDQYIVYVPSQNIREVSPFTISTLTLLNCGNDVSVQVAAMNRVGCVGLNSSEIQALLLDLPTVSTLNGSATTGDRSATTERGSTTSNVATIAVLTTVILIVLVAAVAVILFFYYQKVTDAKKTAENARENFISSLGSLYDALIQNKISSMQVAVRQLLDLILEKKMPSDDIKEALKTVLESEITSAIGVRLVFRQLRKKIPKVMSAIDDELPATGKLTKNLSKEPHEELKEQPKRGRKISLMELVEAGEGNHQESFDELKKEVNNASSQIIKDRLQKLFQALQDTEEENSIAEQRKHGHGLEEVFVAMADRVGKAPPERVKRYLQEFVKNLQDASDSDLSLPPTFGPGVTGSRRQSAGGHSIGELPILHENESQDDDITEMEHIV